MKRRIFLLVLWMLLLTFVPSRPAWAYIDPATTTYIIQVITALVITLGVSLSIFVYRFQMIVTNLKVLLSMMGRRFSEQKKTTASDAGPSDRGQDNSTGPLTEEEALSACIIDCQIPARVTYPALASYSCCDATVEANAESGSEKPVAERTTGKGRIRAFGHWLWSDQRSFKNRLWKAALIAFAVTMTYGIFNMVDSLVTNKTQFSFTFADAIAPTFIFSLIMFVVLLLIFICCKGRVFDFAICLSLSFLICGYLQNIFFNTGIGELTGKPLDWESLGVPSVLINLLFWIAGFSVVFVLGFIHRPRIQQIFKGLLLFVPSLLIVVQAVALFSILPPTGEWKGSQGTGSVPALSREHLYEVSSNKNVLVFIIDMMDEDYINLLAEEDPHFFDNLDGFTRYTNNISVYNSTYPSIVNLLTDVPYDPNVTPEEYIERAYTHRSFLNDIQDRGYVCNLFIEKPHAYKKEIQLKGLADNLGESVYFLKTWKIPIQLFRLSLFKGFPLAFKSLPFLYPDISFWNMGDWKDGSMPYWSDDPLFYRGLATDGLEMTSEPHFVFYHLDGFHTPWNMNSRAEHIEEGVPGEEQFKGSFFILDEYFRQLKEYGLYKDATIIITGDHAQHTGHKALDKPMLVGLFAKPSGEEGTPLRYSNAPVSIQNLRATCVKASGGDPMPWGRTYYEISEDDSAERYYFNRFTDTNNNHFMARYRVVGDARDWANWELLEIVPIDNKNWFY
jgi:hypothetical protein